MSFEEDPQDSDDGSQLIFCPNCDFPLCILPVHPTPESLEPEFDPPSQQAARPAASQDAQRRKRQPVPSSAMPR